MISNQNLTKIKGVFNISKKANYLVIGADNLKCDKKKVFLVIHSKECGKTITKVAEQTKLRTECEVISIDNNLMFQITGLETCKIIAFRNKGISEQIINILRGENFD